MPWNTRDAMSLKEEFITLARQPSANIRALCRQYGISPQTGYKWLRRFEQDGEEGLKEKSRRPAASPTQTAPGLEAEVIALRQAHPAWGGRKISHVLDRRISPSTVTNVLHRHGLITPEASAAATPWKRFEHEAPNDLWQMDFKGYFQTGQGVCHPLTMIDDHSRFNLVIQACAHQRGPLVQEHMTEVFRRYGIPLQINVDNGAPWGAPRNPGELTPLGIWLVRLGIHLSFSRPRHPQTNGKNERFHRSFKAEVLNGCTFRNLNEAQQAFDQWREIYNHRRPHEALNYKTPMHRYRISQRAFPRQLGEFEYSPEDVLVKPYDSQFRFKKRSFRIAHALSGHTLALRPSKKGPEHFDVFFCHHKLRTIDFNQPDSKR
ncbi:IS481 family transposase [Pseudomonas sp. 21LCFQ010]|uniref:IS481 family transposase n=1 Tax=Pseudomonas sp. 21LCFQ010 TaxID=2957506 RepID=UPI0020982800|nr:IS481 family transposase [Pseudomonas sp. 21LCFQ010]MCO8161367.1 IS481 family transposase [Pseudomonas sp. 21LCFQ010]